MNMNLFTCILIMYGILILVNIPAPFLGLQFEESGKQRRWFQPPGYVIPIAWFVLFTLLGVAMFQLEENGQRQFTFRIIGLAVLCATYAYYTLGLAKITGISALWFGLWGNVVVIAVAILVAWNIYEVLPSAAWLVIPVAVWTSYATLIVIGELRMKHEKPR